jgi:hypothetical protein
VSDIDKAIRIDRGQLAYEESAMPRSIISRCRQALRNLTDLLKRSGVNQR